MRHLTARLSAGTLRLGSGIRGRLAGVGGGMAGDVGRWRREHKRLPARPRYPCRSRRALHLLDFRRVEIGRCRLLALGDVPPGAVSGLHVAHLVRVVPPPHRRRPLPGLRRLKHSQRQCDCCPSPQGPATRLERVLNARRDPVRPVRRLICPQEVVPCG